MQRRESVFCVLFPQSGPFIEEERGGPSVDLGCTKGALILSREPNQPTEKHVQKETSLSSMAIEPPQWTPQIKPWRESKARMWEMCSEVCALESARPRGRGGVVVGQQAPIISNRSRYCRGPEGVITLVSEPPPALRGNSPPLQRNVHSHGAPSIIPEPE